jgi:carbon monoxide dehydrogenase subunit G
MEIGGRYQFKSGRQDVWKALQDPQTLATTLPGVRQLEVVGPDRYAVMADVGVGSVKGVYEGTFGLEEKKDFENCLLRGSARGSAGSVEVDVKVRLEDANGGTLLHYDADAKVAGPIAGVGQRMIGAASKKMASEFFGGIDRALAGEVVPSPAAAAVGGESPSGRVGTVFTKPPSPPDEMQNFIRGMVVGFVLALIGVAFGRRIARNDR